MNKLIRAFCITILISIFGCTSLEKKSYFKKCIGKYEFDLDYTSNQIDRSKLLDYVGSKLILKENARFTLGNEKKEMKKGSWEVEFIDYERFIILTNSDGEKQQIGSCIEDNCLLGVPLELNELGLLNSLYYRRLN